MKKRKVMQKALSTVISAALAVCALPVMVSADTPQVEGGVPVALNINQELNVGNQHTNTEADFGSFRVRTIQPATEPDDSKVKVIGGNYCFKARKTGYDSIYEISIIDPLYPEEDGWEIVGMSFDYGPQTDTDGNAIPDNRHIVVTNLFPSGTQLSHLGGSAVQDFVRDQQGLRRSFTFQMNSDSNTSYYVPISNIVIYLGIRPDKVEVTPERVDLAVGESSAPLTSSVTPTNCTFPCVWYTDDSSIATVDENGVITAVGPGQTTIRCRCGDEYDAVTVVVTLPVESVSIEGAPTTAVVPGTVIPLTGSYTPTDATVGTISWSIDDASISAGSTITQDPQNPLSASVTAGAAGTITVTLSVGGVSKTADIVVTDPSASFSPDSLSLYAGGATGSTTLTVDSRLGTNYRVEPSTDGDACFTYSVQGNVVTITPTAVGTGRLIATIVYNTDKRVTAACTITVSAPPVDSVSIEGAPTTALLPGGGCNLTGVVAPPAATGAVTWTVDDPSIARISWDPATPLAATVTAVGPGTATVTLDVGGKTATASIPVSAPSASFTPDSLSFDVGSPAATTTLSVDPRLGTGYTVVMNQGGDNCFTYNVSGNVVTITPTAPGTGSLTATINYTGGSLSVVCAVSVATPPAVVVDAQDVSFPYDGNLHGRAVTAVDPTDATIYYGSDPTSCTDPNVPTFSAIGAHTVYYSASHTGYTTTTGSYTVTITDPTPQPVPIDPGSVIITGGPDSGELVVGDTWQLTSGYTPDNATVTSVVWTSSDESVATVDSTGKITAVAPGTAVITVTYNNDPALSYSITITVVEPAPGPEPGPEPEPTPEPEPDPEPTLTPEQIRQMSINQFVERLYLTALGRQHEIMGRDYWVDHLNNDYSGSYVGTGFIHSQEFLGFDLNDDEYVNSLYRAFCDRLPSDPERTNWTNALAGGATRDQVLFEFLASQEWDSICAFYSVKTH